jgi:hypothetical protein
VTREDKIVAFLRAAERGGLITRSERLEREGRLLLVSMRKAGLVAARKLSR